MATTSPSSSSLHVYDREIRLDERTSLSVLAAHIAPGARVLDVGCGSGAVGRFLKARDGALAGPVDGLTISEDEARIARAHYRRVEVANLEDPAALALFERGAYDMIVCADVLEHVRTSEAVLASCLDLLAPAGRALLSIPNAAYAGLMAELMEGEFRYRQEGLLDATHVRFFTRRTLMRFLRNCGWAALSVETVRRELPDSEFATAFDTLPPAVARHLLALPDALTYQFIVAAEPASAVLAEPVLPEPDPPPAQALFTAQLYLGNPQGFSEERKVTARGAIGQALQVIAFALPAAPVTCLKFDPADRPGFVHLHAMALKSAAGDVLWRWSSRDAATLVNARRSGLVASPPAWLGAPLALLCYDGDPWIELPIPPALLACATAGRLEVGLGWPMSADYLALAAATQQEVAAAQAATQAARKEQLTERAIAASAACDAEMRLNAATQAHAQSERALADAREENEQQLADARASATRTLARVQEEAARALAQANEQAQRELQQTRDNLRSQCEQALSRAREAGRLTLARTRNEAKKLYDKETLKHEQFMARAREQIAALQLQVSRLRDDNHHLRAANASIIAEREGARRFIQEIEQSTVFRATRPVVHAKMRIDRWLGIGSARKAPSPPAVTVPTPLKPSDAPVDIIVPVYKGLLDTQRCVRSVLASHCATPWRLVVINDASPEPAVTDWLRSIDGTDPRLLLLENPENLGFVGTVNRGMALTADRDVLLLNSDTEVARDWLDRIRHAAYGDQRAASVTPFSNNATICSYPRFCADNDLPLGMTTAHLDELFARTNPGQAVDVPTGVGFCMYIRRQALLEVGLFDEANFGKGYGEENDFCVRAANAGWRNLHALDTFVRHFGGVSFGDSKSPRERAAMETLRRLHPRYEPEVMRFVQADPARRARLMVDLARILDGGRPLILAVLHDRQGGTERHVIELAATLRDKAQFLVLRPLPDQRVSLRLPAPGEAFELVFSLVHEYEQLLAALRQLGVCHIHFHHLLGQADAIRQLPARLALEYDFTAHDYYTVCPQISLTLRDNRYCGEVGEQQCSDCLVQSPAPGGADIASWRASHAEFLAGARFVLAPARDVTIRLMRYLPDIRPRVVPHTDIDPSVALPEPKPALLTDGRPLKVAVIGALSAIKGADVLEDVAIAARKRGAPLEFHLIGFGYRALKTQPSAALTVHGKYDEAALPELLDWLKPDVVWFPAQWPETYSYTLSACLQAGLPVVAPDIGAFVERLQGRRWSWVHSWEAGAAQWLSFFEDIRTRHFATGQSPAPLLSIVPDEPRVPPAVAPQRWYASEYLAGLPRVTPDPVALQGALLSSHQPPAPAALRAAGLKGRALETLVRLRARPALAGLARAVPGHWQRRIKNWLVR